MSSIDVSVLSGRLERLLAEAVEDSVTPSATAVVLIGDAVVGPIAVGDAVRFGAGGKVLDPPVPATSDTVYDLASVTKVFTALTALTLVDDGVLRLDEPIAGWLPQFSTAEKSTITLRHLLTHTSGLPGVWEGWRTDAAPDRPTALEGILASPLTTRPGNTFDYSCVGFNTVMALAETATGLWWADLVDARVLRVLRERDARASALTMTPDAVSCAATEYQPELGRGMVRGTVHDEAAAALGGGAGNAGMFGTAESVAALGGLLLDGAPEVLRPETAAEMWRDQLPGILGADLSSRGPGYGHGLGLRIGQTEWMSAQGIDARGHNGFTGTSLLVDREAGIVVVLLTNLVHPSRHLSDVRPLRHDVADAAYRAAAA